MRITDWLRVQHGEFRELLHKIELAQHDPGSSGAGEVRRLLKRLLPRLKAHERVEDELLSPVLRGAVKGIEPGLTSIFMEGHEELHGKLDRLQEALGMGTAPLSQFVAAVDFGSLLKEHMEQEERILFPIVERSLPLETLEELATQAEALAAKSAPAAPRKRR